MKFTMYLLKRLWRDIIRKVCIAAAVVTLILAMAWLTSQRPVVVACVVIALLLCALAGLWALTVWEDFNDDPENQ